MDLLERYGWDDRVAERFVDVATEGRSPARVTRVHRINCDVVTAEGEMIARPSPTLTTEGGASLPAAGDWVALGPPIEGDEPMIVAVVPRWSAISRRDPADRASEQVLAADVDVVLIVHGLDQELNLRRIERSLVLAHVSGASPMVVLTKADLADETDAIADQVREIALDAPVAVTSSVTGAGLETLRTAAHPNRTLAVIGASGAGKSSLINRLVGEEVQETADVRLGDAKGRHTTTMRELIPLPDGGVVIDTPGLRGLGLWDADAGILLAFADITELAHDCRFRDCAHEHEPGCAVKGAIATGHLDQRRLASYRRLVDEMDDLTRRQEEQERKDRRAKNRRR